MTNADASPGDERRGGFVRRVLSQGPSPEKRLEELLAQRRLELDEHASRLHESIVELERREELLRDSRASVERMLRIGMSDLETRETELTGFLTDLTDRETMLSQAEAELALRRQELGAVELKRATVERRDRAVTAREEQLAELEAEIASVAPSGHPEDAVNVELAFVPGQRYTLVEIDATPLTRGYVFEVGGDGFVVSRIGRSPLPADARRCAYLVRGTRDDGAGFVGSS